MDDKTRTSPKYKFFIVKIYVKYKLCNKGKSIKYRIWICRDVVRICIDEALVIVFILTKNGLLFIFYAKEKRTALGVKIAMFLMQKSAFLIKKTPGYIPMILLFNQFLLPNINRLYIKNNIHRDILHAHRYIRF
jgi:hypothetical protein